MRVLRSLRWPKFLKPQNPAEAYQLALLVGLVFAGIGYAVKTVLPGSTPWNEQADTICLDAGDAYVSVHGTRSDRLRDQVRIMEDESAKLSSVSVPTRYVLRYHSLLDTKQEEVTLLAKELALSRAGSKPLPSDSLLGVRRTYEFQAQELPLNVCGQGSGHG